MRRHCRPCHGVLVSVGCAIAELPSIGVENSSNSARIICNRGAPGVLGCARAAVRAGLFARGCADRPHRNRRSHETEPVQQATLRRPDIGSVDSRQTFNQPDAWSAVSRSGCVEFSLRIVSRRQGPASRAREDRRARWTFLDFVGVAGASSAAARTVRSSPEHAASISTTHSRAWCIFPGRRTWISPRSRST